ncbi:MAG: hypothetical protein ACWGSQ_04285, partial [Longimicrobiales bacterium]
MTIDASSGPPGALTENEKAGEEKKAGPPPDRPPPGGRIKKGGKEGRPTQKEAEEKGDRKRTLLILLGVVLFGLVYLSPTPPDAVSPLG